MPPTDSAKPKVSVVVLVYNGKVWLPRCLASLRAQTICAALELIVVDNCSTDESVAVARGLLAGWPGAVLVENKENFGFCEGNNIGARVAHGEYLFFLNPDTWLEPDCLEQLLAETDRAQTGAASPWVLNYEDNSHQDLGFFGFDIFGLASPSAPAGRTRDIFVACGCACLVRRDVFSEVGMFDREFFMYGDEVDLSWRVWAAGHRIIGVPEARLHHRGAATVNPAGGAKVVEYRTSDRKRFFSNRNGLLVLLKNGQHLLLLLAPLQVLLLLAETVVGWVMLRRWSFVQTTFVAALRDVWRLRRHVWRERERMAALRRRSDWWMLRFFRLPLNRWFEIKRLFKFGLPKVN